MISGLSIGELAISEFDHVSVDGSGFATFLARVTGATCWLIELDVLSLAAEGGLSDAPSDHAIGEIGISGDLAGVVGAGEATLRFSTHGYKTHNTDSPAYTYYDNRLTGDVSINRSIAGRDGIGGLTVANGTVNLVNADGELDLIKLNYAIEGRSARVLVGRPTDALADFGVVFRGVVQSVKVGQVVTIALSDGSAKLRRAVNEARYAGTGALEGGDDLKGKPKPKTYGAARGVRPPLVDSTKLIYQVNDGAIQDVPDVYDRGIVLTQGADYTDEAALNATAPSAGQYRVYKGGGYFRLGSTPTGELTCDVEGDATLSGYVSRVGEIVQRILSEEAQLASSELDATSLTTLNGAVPASVGIYLPPEPRSCAEVIDELLWSVGCFGGFERTGAFAVGLVSPAGGAQDLTLTATEIINVDRLPMPGPVEPVVWRVSVAYERNYTVQTDFAAAVTAAQRTFAAEPYRVAKAESGLISRHLLAREMVINGYFTTEADAEAEAERLLSLWGQEPLRAYYSVDTRFLGVMGDIGSVVHVTWPRHGMRLGVLGRVLAQRIRGTNVTLEIVV